MDYGIERETIMKRECIMGVAGGEVSEYCWEGGGERQRYKNRSAVDSLMTMVWRRKDSG